MSRLQVGIAQLNTRSKKEDNIAAAGTLVRRLAANGAELVVLPEHSDFIGPDAEKRFQAETTERSIYHEAMRKLAMELEIWLHLGSFLEKEGESVYNTAMVLSPAGEVVAKYRKIHLFDVEIPGGRKYLESETITAGEKVVSFQLGDFRVGLATCYDLRFPELFRALALQGMDVLLLPAAFTLQTGRDHWELLLKARAVENQCWVVAAGQWGFHPPKHSSFGRSMVINPWGIVVAQAADGVKSLLYQIELETVAEIRRNFPVLHHIRKDLFFPVG